MAGVAQVSLIYCTLVKIHRVLLVSARLELSWNGASGSACALGSHGEFSGTHP